VAVVWPWARELWQRMSCMLHTLLFPLKPQPETIRAPRAVLSLVQHKFPGCFISPSWAWASTMTAMDPGCTRIQQWRWVTHIETRLLSSTPQLRSTHQLSGLSSTRQYCAVDQNEFECLLPLLVASSCPLRRCECRHLPLPTFFGTKLHVVDKAV